MLTQKSFFNSLLDTLWKRTYRYWKEVIQYEGFWSRVNARIRELDDPRLTSGVARRIRASMPTALLSINAFLAVHAAEQGDFDTAKRHKSTMKASGWEIDAAIIRAVEPVRSRIAILCKSAEKDSDTDPVHADRIGQRLLDQSRPLLSVLDCMLPADHSTRIHAHDEVALKTRLCQIDFGNKTENWKKSLELLEQALLIAISESTRLKIESEIKIVSDNLESGGWWCGEGYYELPGAILELAEQARAKEDAGQLDEAIKILKAILTGSTTRDVLGEKDITLIRKSLAYCLNRRWVKNQKKYHEQHNEQLKIFDNLLKSGKIGGLGYYCNVCNCRLVGQYMVLTYQGKKYDLCLNCNNRLEQEKKAREDRYIKALVSTSEDLLLARLLDPKKKVIEDNLAILKEEASKSGAQLPNGELLLMKSGLATLYEIKQVLDYSGVFHHRMAAKDAYKRLAPEKYKAKQDEQIKRKFRAVPVYGSAIAIFIVMFTLIYILAGYHHNNPSVVHGLYRIRLISQDACFSRLIAKISDGKTGISQQESIVALLENEIHVTKDNLPLLIDSLGHDDKYVRIIAAKMLPKLGQEAKEAIPALEKALHDKESEVRQYSAETLSTLNRESIPVFIRLLSDYDENVRKTAAESLGKMGQEAIDSVPALTKLLHDQSFEVRVAAEEALKTILNKDEFSQILSQENNHQVEKEAPKVIEPQPVEIESVSELIKALKDEDYNTRQAAAEKLGKMGPKAKKAIPSLTAALDDDWNVVRLAAKDALRAIGEQDNIERRSPKIPRERPALRTGEVNNPQQRPVLSTGEVSSD